MEKIIFFITFIGTVLTLIAYLTKLIIEYKKTANDKTNNEFEKYQENARREREKNAQRIAERKKEWEKQQDQKIQIPEHNFTVEKPPAPKPPPIDFTKKLLDELGLSEIPTEKKPKWTLELLMSLEWKRFEEVCKEYLAMTGHNAQLTQIGADGGIDIKIYQNDQLVNIVQCKAWTWKINVKEIRELYGIMASEKVNAGIYITTSSFTQDAISFSQGKNIKLINGESLIKEINYLPPEKQNQLLKFATAGDYITPTCPRCNTRMIKRNGRYSDFWGCMNFPRCRHKQKIRRA